MFMGAPLVLALCRLYPRWARWYSPFGLLVCFLSLLTTSFRTTVPQLIGVQGALFGVGGCFAFGPCIVFIDQWFDKRKGLAFGRLARRRRLQEHDAHHRRLVLRARGAFGMVHQATRSTRLDT
jgi:hypothetical protein